MVRAVHARWSRTSGSWWSSCKGRPFALIGVNARRGRDRPGRGGEAVRVNWRSFKNAAGDGPSITDLWNVGGVPTLYLIDHPG